MEQLDAAEHELEAICSRLSSDEIQTKQVEKHGDAELIRHGDFVEIHELQSVADLRSAPKSEQRPIATEEDRKRENEEVDDVMRLWQSLTVEESGALTQPNSSNDFRSSGVADPSDIFNFRPQEETLKINEGTRPPLKPAMKHPSSTGESQTPSKAVHFDQEAKEASAATPSQESLNSFTGVVHEKNTDRWASPPSSDQQVSFTFLFLGVLLTLPRLPSAFQSSKVKETQRNSKRSRPIPVIGCGEGREHFIRPTCTFMVCN